FEGANLRNAILTDAKTDGANFDAAIMPDGNRQDDGKPAAGEGAQRGDRNRQAADGTHQE
ncbi:MAG: pentapeptide repeat-containing protein, partial [Bradyrhizobiaceae bacterium]|nr:pentapeptide repeat-containing protein [Bradyrhizobiaceae bacterium]